MTYTKRILTALASGAVLLNAMAPAALADTTLTITGNGSDSHSSVNLSNSSNTTVVQNNTANVTNNVHTDVSTGGNRASDNTGGNVVVDTGNAKSTVSLTTVANSNRADVNGCAACNGGNATVNISGNGSDSSNHVNLDNFSNTGVYQSNDANVQNNVHTDATTGNNDANRNTGGDVTVYTGNATSNVDVNNALNANVAHVGGNSAGTGADIKVLGNGSDSRNSVNLNNTPSTLITQDNGAYVTNDIHSSLKTGHNDANDNTGGNVTVDTGNATSHVGVDTMANFNAADVDCGCMMGGVNAKVADNGSDSHNRIAADLGGNLSVFQGSADAGNDAVVNNNVDPRLDTGRNDANRNTGAGYNDPVYVVTGHSNSDTSVSNALNQNVFGQGSAIELPGGTHVSFNFDMSAFMNSLHFSL